MILRVLDLETSGLKLEEGALPIELAFVDIDTETIKQVGQFHTYLTLGNKKIPPGAKAVNHIQDEQLIDAPTLAQIAHIVYSPDVVLVAHNLDFDIEFLPGYSSGLCTLKLARMLYEGLDSYTNMFLYYYFNHKVEDITAHTALSDAKVTAELVKKIIREQHVYRTGSLEPLYGIQAEADFLFPFGKYKGKDARKVNDLDYITWFVNNTDPKPKQKAALISILKGE